MSTSLNPLVDKIRATHPGAYDDLSDAELTSKIVAKYPQYGDLALPYSKSVPKGLQGAPEAKPIQMTGTPPLQEAIQDFSGGKVARGVHRLVTASGSALAPLAVPALATAPLATVGAIGAGAVGQMVGKYGGEAAGLTPDQADVAGDVTGLAAGYAGSKAFGQQTVGDVANKVFRDPSTGKITVSPLGIAHNVLNRAFPEEPTLPFGPYGPTRVNNRPGGFMPEGKMEAPAVYGPTRVNPEDVDPASLPNYYQPQGPARINPSEIDPTSLPDYYAPQGPARVNPQEIDAASLPDYYAPQGPTRINPPEATPSELGSPENPGFVAKLPSRMPKPPKQSAPSIVPPNAGNLDPALRRVGSEGRGATWTNESIMQGAAKGDREAIAQAILRRKQLPENARYVMGDANYPASTYNPRDVTTFSPEGTPIRQGTRVQPINTDFQGARVDYDTADAGSLNDILNDPSASAADKAMALASLKRNGHFAKTVIPR